MSVRPAHVRLMAIFVDNPVVQAHRSDVAGCSKLWDRECQRAGLPPCPFDLALRTWSAKEVARAGEFRVGPPDLDGQVVVTVRTPTGDVNSTTPARTLFLLALRAYAQTYTDQVRFMQDVYALATVEVRAMRPPSPS